MKNNKSQIQRGLQFVAAFARTRNGSTRIRTLASAATDWIHTVVLVALLVGCQTTDKPKERTFPSILDNPFTNKEPEQKPPHRIAIVWRDAVYTEPGKLPTRGFGGRVYFYGEDNEPVEVEGELTVFGYDDSNESMKSKVANRKFVYEGNHLKHYFRETDLGPSYDVWIPWDAVGGERKNISLVPVFRTEEGNLLRGELARNILPGKKPLPGIERVNEEIASKRATSSIRPITYRTPQQQPQSYVDSPGTTVSFGHKPEIQTTTIPVPPSLSRQLKAPQSVARSMTPQPTPQPLNNVTYGQRPGGWTSPATAYENRANPRTRQSPVFGAPGALPSRRQSMGSTPTSDLPTLSPQSSTHLQPKSQVQAGLVGSPSRIRMQN